MAKYIAKRLLLMIPTLLGAAVLVFFLMRAIPGDVCAIKLGGTGAYVDQSMIDACHHQLGLDKPMIVQFFQFIWGFVTFHFGTSMWSGLSILHEIGLRFQVSLQIAIMATMVAVIIAVPLGAISALKQNTWIDYIVRVFSILGIAIPSFWFGIVIILGLLIVTQAWFGSPWMPPIDWVAPWKDPVSNFSMMIWPAAATGYRYSAVATRMTRSALLEVMREDYVRTARAKGLIEKVVINKHALKNALLPVVTIFGIEFAFLIGGLVVTEQVFNLNGIGRLFVQAVLNQDYSMTQYLVMLVVTVFIVTNFIIDLFYAWLDPRIRYS